MPTLGQVFGLPGVTHVVPARHDPVATSAALGQKPFHGELRKRDMV